MEAATKRCTLYHILVIDMLSGQLVAAQYAMLGSTLCHSIDKMPKRTAWGGGVLDNLEHIKNGCISIRVIN